jgi:hypothetical protein
MEAPEKAAAAAQERRLSARQRRGGVIFEAFFAAFFFFFLRLDQGFSSIGPTFELFGGDRRGGTMCFFE